MQIKRHNFFRKDELKVKLTDEQYQKRIEYLSCILNDEPLPIEASDHSLTGEYQGFREFHLSSTTASTKIINTEQDEREKGT